MKTWQQHRKITLIHWLSLFALLTSAAFLGKPRTTATAQTPAVAFTVRGYGGKCLEFGMPRTRVEQTTPTTYPVFIADCNGSVAQQVRVEELTDRDGHLVILRAGNGVIGKKSGAPVLTQNDSSGSPSSTGIADQTPLEVQSYSGSEGQIFALDGDSIILAAERNLVIEVQNHRGQNQTPLVLGRRNLDEAEFWDFTAVDGSGKRPTSGFVSIKQATPGPGYYGELSARLAFLEALQQAHPGTVIELDESVAITLEFNSVLEIPKGVTIRGDRRGTRLGAELRDYPSPANSMFVIVGDDVRITGLRLRGPSRNTDADTLKAVGIFARDDLFKRLIIDHNELSDWSETAVLVNGGEEAKVCPVILQDSQGGSVRPSRHDIRIVRNFIHHNQRQGGGYGVGTYDSGFPLIEGNTFVSNRHAIASDGYTRTGYRAWYNLVLSTAPLQVKAGGLYTWHTHDFDMHGTGTLSVPVFDDVSGFGGIGGHYVEIARNTFLGTNRANFDLRGEPCYLAEFHHNVSLQGYTKVSPDLPLPGGVEDRPTILGGAIECSYCGGGIDKLNVYANQFKAPNPTNRLGVGDFDGDGKDDLFLATGAAWYYAPAGQAEWRFLNAQTDKINTLLFGDFDADGRTDVFTQHSGNRWDVSWGGASKWETINGSGPLLGNAAIGDFNGDGRADVFYTDGAQWLVSYSGTGYFTHMAAAIHRVADLRFGDFNRDGKTDVFGVVGNLWMVVHGGTQFWAPLRAKLTDSVADLTVADFDGDGRADVARTHPLLPRWLVARGGTGEWTELRASGTRLNAVPAIGRFDAAPGADVLTWAPSNAPPLGLLGPHNALDIASGGAGASQRHSRHDMR